MRNIFTLILALGLSTALKATPVHLLGNEDSIFQFKTFLLDSLPKYEYNCWMTETNVYEFRYAADQLESKNLIVRIAFANQTVYEDTSGSTFRFAASATGVYRITLVNKLKASDEIKVAQAQQIFMPAVATKSPEEIEEERIAAEKRAKREAEKAAKQAQKAQKAGKEVKEETEKAGKETKSKVKETKEEVQKGAKDTKSKADSSKSKASSSSKSKSAAAKKKAEAKKKAAKKKAAAKKKKK